MKTKNIINFEKLVSNENSGWLDKFLQYKKTINETTTKKTSQNK